MMIHNRRNSNKYQIIYIIISCKYDQNNEFLQKIPILMKSLFPIFDLNNKIVSSNIFL